MKKRLGGIPLIIFVACLSCLASAEELSESSILGYAIQEKLVRAQTGQDGSLDCKDRISVDFTDTETNTGAALKKEEAVQLDGVFYCKDSLNIAALTSATNERGIIISEAEHPAISKTEAYKKVKQTLLSFEQQTTAKGYLNPTSGFHIYTALNPKPIHLAKMIAHPSKDNEGAVKLAEKFKAEAGTLRQTCLSINPPQETSFSSEIDAGKAGQEQDLPTYYYNLAVFDSAGSFLCSAIGTQGPSLDLKGLFANAQTISISRNFVVRLRQPPSGLGEEELKWEPVAALTLERSLTKEEFEDEKAELKTAGLDEETLKYLDADAGGITLQLGGEENFRVYYLFNGTFFLNYKGEIVGFDYSALAGKNYSYGSLIDGQYTFPSGTRMSFGRPTAEGANQGVSFPDGIPSDQNGQPQNAKACFGKQCFTLSTNPGGKITGFRKEGDAWVVEGNGFSVTDDASGEKITIKARQPNGIGTVKITTRGFVVGQNTEAEIAGTIIRTREADVLVLHECATEIPNANQNFILPCRQKKELTINGACFETQITDFASYGLNAPTEAVLNYNLRGIQQAKNEDCGKAKSSIKIKEGDALIETTEGGSVDEINCQQILRFTGKKVQSPITPEEYGSSFFSLTGGTTALNRKNIKIVIDAGHGGDDKSVCASGLCEAEKNAEISELLAAKLNSYGYTTILTRTTDGWNPGIEKYICRNNRAECKCRGKGKNWVCPTQRGKFSNDMKADIMISVHNNCKGCNRFVIYPGVGAYGSCGGRPNLCGKNNKRCLESEELAKTVQASLQATNPRVPYKFRSTGKKKGCSRYGILTSPNHLSLIIEFASIDDPDLRNFGKVNGLAQAVADGINSYVTKNQGALPQKFEPLYFPLPAEEEDDEPDPLTDAAEAENVPISSGNLKNRWANLGAGRKSCVNMKSIYNKYIIDTSQLSAVGSICRRAVNEVLAGYAVASTGMVSAEVIKSCNCQKVLTGEKSCAKTKAEAAERIFGGEWLTNGWLPFVKELASEKIVPIAAVQQPARGHSWFGQIPTIACSGKKCSVGDAQIFLKEVIEQKTRDTQIAATDLCGCQYEVNVGEDAIMAYNNGEATIERERGSVKLMQPVWNGLCPLCTKKLVLGKFEGESIIWADGSWNNYGQGVSDAFRVHASTEGKPVPSQFVYLLNPEGEKYALFATNLLNGQHTLLYKALPDGFAIDNALFSNC